jgi:hypothetical protein
LQDNFNLLWEDNLITALAESKETIITGDINCDYLKRNDNLELKEIFSSNGFSQLVDKPTRITEHSKTLIDVIQSTSPETIARVEVIPLGLSDHDMVGCVRKLNHHKFPPKLITIQMICALNCLNLRSGTMCIVIVTLIRHGFQ